MAKARRQKVGFIAKKRVRRPVRVKFYTRTGKEVSFKAHKKITRPVRVKFYAKKKKKN